MRTRRIYRGEITAQMITTAYLEAFHVPWWRRIIPFFNVNILLADQTYAEANRAKIKQVLEVDKTERQQYEAEEFDCDDFAFSLMGAFHRNRDTAAMPIFITWVQMSGGGHALLSFCLDGQILMIEPQTDDIFPVPEGWDLMLVCG